MILEYFEKFGCPVCEQVELHLLPKLYMRFRVKRYQVDLFKNLLDPAILAWAKATKGMVPAVRYIDSGRVVWAVGLSDIRKLAEDAERWSAMNLSKRRIFPPIEAPVEVPL